jgi:DNA-binding MarR family transcriptional regulator
MNELDLLIFHIAHNPVTIKDLYEKIHKASHRNVAQKALYTSIDRLEKQGFITKKQQGKLMLVQQSPQPISSYLHTVLENQPHFIKKQILTATSLDILLTILHNSCTVKWIQDITQLSERNTRRYLSKLHKAAIITKHQEENTPHSSTWKINTLQRELLQFLEAYEEHKTLQIIEDLDISATPLWIHGIEFLIRTPQSIHQKQFKQTGAAALGHYGMKLLSTENFYLYTRRTLDLWDHAYLTVLSRKNDTNQLRYLAYLYKKHQTNATEFIQKGTYYDSQSMQLILDLFTQNKETAQLTIQDVNELEKLYGVP